MLNHQQRLPDMNLISVLIQDMVILLLYILLLPISIICILTMFIMAKPVLMLQ